MDVATGAVATLFAPGKAAAEKAAQQKVSLEKALVPWRTVERNRSLDECLLEGDEGGRAWREQRAESL